MRQRRSPGLSGVQRQILAEHHFDQGKVISLKRVGVKLCLRAHSVSHNNSIVRRRIARNRGRTQSTKYTANRATRESPRRQDQKSKTPTMARGTANNCPIIRPRSRASCINRACSVGLRCAQISRTSADWNGDHVDSEMSLRGVVTPEHLIEWFGRRFQTTKQYEQLRSDPTVERLSAHLVLSGSFQPIRRPA